MPFITSLGRRPCNVCRKVTPKGGTVYHGEITGMEWCLACAETTLHKTPDISPPVPVTQTWNTEGVTVTPVQYTNTDDFTVTPARYTKTLEKFKPAAVPSWFERED